MYICGNEIVLTCTACVVDNYHLGSYGEKNLRYLCQLGQERNSNLEDDLEVEQEAFEAWKVCEIINWFKNLFDPV